MKKMVILFAAFSTLLFSSLSPVSAAPTAAQTCIVSGDKIKGDKFQTVYEGKTYKFCCGGCMRKFKKNPAKYIA